MATATADATDATETMDVDEPIEAEGDTRDLFEDNIILSTR